MKKRLKESQRRHDQGVEKRLGFQAPKHMQEPRVRPDVNRDVHGTPLAGDGTSRR